MGSPSRRAVSRPVTRSAARAEDPGADGQAVAATLITHVVAIARPVNNSITMASPTALSACLVVHQARAQGRRAGHGDRIVHRSRDCHHVGDQRGCDRLTVRPRILSPCCRSRNGPAHCPSRRRSHRYSRRRMSDCLLALLLLLLLRSLPRRPAGSCVRTDPSSVTAPNLPLGPLGGLIAYATPPTISAKPMAPHQMDSAATPSTTSP